MAQRKGPSVKADPELALSRTLYQIPLAPKPLEGEALEEGQILETRTPEEPRRKADRALFSSTTAVASQTVTKALPYSQSWTLKLDYGPPLHGLSNGQSHQSSTPAAPFFQSAVPGLPDQIMPPSYDLPADSGTVSQAARRKTQKHNKQRMDAIVPRVHNFIGTLPELLHVAHLLSELDIHFAALKQAQGRLKQAVHEFEVKGHFSSRQARQRDNAVGDIAAASEEIGNLTRALTAAQRRQLGAH
ncbi:hypothetical protein GGR56DRAFT_52227 [Xylariaceae sp. FL0804]|nr:hypothetical protein GGR56DRAFT_52227 [Xylariaceae sp. FL0804]